MRVLVVDQDSTLLTAITQTLGEYFSIDAVTTKADCLDLVRLNDFDVIVAGERLEDGSGLELLGSLARSRPGMLRIFAAERERLKLLKGRLGPFGLFRTLSYPIEPRQLLAALSAAAGINDFEERLQAQEAATAGAAAAETLGSAATASAPSRAPTATASRAQASVPSAASPPSRATTQQPRGASAARSSSPVAPSSRQGPRQPTPAALAAASKLDIVTRPKGFPPTGEPSAARSGFLVGAGVILVLGGLALSFKIFNTKDEPVTLPTNTAALRAKHFPPEVVKLVADTEVAFEQDDFKTARTDVAALQQIAPDHPRLPLFESLLNRLEATKGSKSGSGRFSRHTSPPTASTGTGASHASRAPSTSIAQGTDTQRRQPDTNRDAAAAASAAAKITAPTATSTTGTASAKGPTPSSPLTQTATAVSTFSGRILEESTNGAPTQTLATPSQAMVTPVPRRPGAAAGPSDTQPARLIQHVAADYPPEAARRGVEGSVDVSFTISPQGKVGDVTVINAVPSDIFNRAAITAVRRWKYEPKTVNGVPVEAHQQLRLQFKLDRRG